MKNSLPISPYKFKQEIYKDDPWKMLIVCMMLNQTSHKQVDKVRDIFFVRFPNASSLIAAPDEDVKNIIKPLGFSNKRCVLWKRFSEKWIEGKWNSVLELPGIGRYATDSWEVFQNGNIDINVNDKELKKYVTWAKHYKKLIK